MKSPKFLPLLLVFTMACSVSIADLLPAAAPTAARPAGSPTRSATATRTPTITATLPTPTFTQTPTLIGNRPSATSSRTPTETSRVVFPVTASTSTPIQQNTGFASILISTTHLYWGVCDSNQVTFTAQVTEPEAVFNVVLFVRLKDQKSDDTTEWNTGIAMNDKGNGTFTYTLKGKSIEGYNSYLNAWVFYQLVSTDADGNILGRSQVYTQSLGLSPCP